jgi:DNA-binding HxlR family transcriptional regulator
VTDEVSGAELLSQAGGEAQAAELSTVGALRLLSAGASGAILTVLGKGPLRTKELTERVPGYAPRTIYRYAAKLAELGVVHRDEAPGVPSKVVHSLTDPCGRELYELVEAYADASLPRLPNGDIGAHAWGSLALLADLWESGMIGDLNLGPRTPTELSRGDHGLSFHQVSRRASLFAIGGFIEENSEAGRRRRYALSDQTRRAMALIAGIGRWRRRHIVPAGTTGLTTAEVVGLMQTVLPLVALPQHAGKSFEIRVSTAEEGVDDGMLWADVGADGMLLTVLTPIAKTGTSVRGGVAAWVDSVLDGSHEDLSVIGDAALIADCMHRLHVALWRPAEERT